MIRPGFLDPESRNDLMELAQDALPAHRLARRANALVLLDDGLSCELIAKMLLLDDDTVRTWYSLYQTDGIEGLASFGYQGGICRLNANQQEKLKAWIGATLPRTTREVGAWIAREYGIDYPTRSGLIALLQRLGMEYRKPKVLSRKLDPAKQTAFIKSYDGLLNQMLDDETVIFADAAHPNHSVRPVGCWTPKQQIVAVEQSSGQHGFDPRQRQRHVAQHEHVEHTRAALAQAKIRGVKLGNPQLRAGSPELARQATGAYSAQQRRRAADVLPFIRQAQAAGASTLQSICDAMVARGIPTPGGRGGWHPSTVSRLLALVAL